MSITRVRQPDFTRALSAVVMLWVGVSVPLPTKAASITEPATVFYGKIIGTGGSQPFLVTQGKLEWTIRRADGRDLLIRANLFPLERGKFSYRLDVPHEAMALGLGASLSSVPLAPTQQTHKHTGILVNGQPARIASGGGSAFSAAQASRAATYRLDLEVPLEPSDSDGDGIPDWWEAKFGLDQRSGTDADGDGLSNLQEYLRGSDPTRSNGEPTLATTEILAYAEGTTGVMLRTIDADSDAGSLTYTLMTAPSAGTLVLRNAHQNPASPDALLSAGSQFTQQDISEGRVVFAHSGAATDPVTFEVNVRDENPAHAPSSGSVRVNLYRPAASTIESVESVSKEQLLASALGSEPIAGAEADEDLRIRNYILSKEAGYIIWDGSSEKLDQEIGALSTFLSPAEYESRFGADRPHVIIGGAGKDKLSGGIEDDILIGRGQDDVLRGNRGADRFVFSAGDNGRDTVADFNGEESDVIDLSRVLKGTSQFLDNYVRLGSDGGNATINVDADGNGDGFSDLVITLVGVSPATTDLHSFVESGRLIVGGVRMLPRVTISATNSNASENGPEAGEFTLTRSGPVESELLVKIGIGGSAVNGIDFSKIDSTITFVRGQRAVTVALTPFADTQPEPAETAELALLSGEGYEAGISSSASLTIEDSQVVVSIETLEPLAVKQALTPGAFLITRSGILDRSVLVRLDISGTASIGTDYQAVLRFVNFAPGQTTALIEVIPNANAVLEGRAETVEISIRPDAAYKVGQNSQARLTLVERDGTFAAWRAREFPQAAGALQVFATSDPGGFGISTLLRYAFGLDPAKPDRGRLPKVSVRDGHLTTEFWRRADATDIDYVVEVSRDLVRWDSSPASVQRLAVDKASDDPSMVRYRTVSATKDQQNLFMNVRVVLKP